MMDAIGLDLRQAWRSIRRAPAFSAAVVLTFALGMAGTTSMFALVEGILLRPLGVPDEDRLVVGWRELPNSGGRRWPLRADDLDALGENSRLLESVGGVGYNDPSPLALVAGDAVTIVAGARVTGDFFRVLGVAPALGRALAAGDDVEGAEAALVIAHGLWQRQYGGSRDVLGRRVAIEGQPFTIVGVMPPDVEHPRGVEAWATVAALQRTLTNDTFRWAMRNELQLVARLRPGATAAQAAADLRAVAARLGARWADRDAPGLVPGLLPFKEDLVGDVRTSLAILFGAVALVLLVAMANAASLMLARGDARRTEYAVRAALGGGRGRLVRQALIESGLLAVASGVVGLAASHVTLQALLRLVPGGLPRTDGVGIDGAVVAFTIALALVVAAATGLLPALSSARASLVSHLRDGRAPAPASRRGTRALVVTQAALALVVLAAAALLSRSLLKLEAVGGTLAADRLVLASLELSREAYADRARQARFVRQLVERLEGAPGVLAATPVNATPFSGMGWDAPTWIAEGQSRARAAANPPLNFEEIHPGYFRTLEVPLVRGRPFMADDDREGAPLVVIVSDDVAALTWPGEDPLGKRLKMGGVDSPDPWRTVVGVAAPTRYRELRAPRASLYVPAAQLLGTARAVVVRTTGSAAAAGELVRTHVRALDAGVRVQRVQPFAELLETPLARPRFNALLVAVFAAAALALLGVGLYAAMAAFVRQRRGEIGVRMALGATAGDVHRLVLGEGLCLAGLGAALGLAGALAVTRVLRGLLFEIEPLDPVALGGAALALAAVAGASLFLPVRAAGRVDPAATLRG